MRIIILFLLISVNVFGQDSLNNIIIRDSILYAIPDTNYWMKYQYKYDNLFIYHGDQGFAEPYTYTFPYYKEKKCDCITLQDLIDYQKECYNDSTLEYEYMIEYWNGVRFDTMYSKTIKRMPECYITQIKKWIHKQPTFEGFIEYLKNK